MIHIYPHYWMYIYNILMKLCVYVHTCIDHRDLYISPEGGREVGGRDGGRGRWLFLTWTIKCAHHMWYIVE